MPSITGLAATATLNAVKNDIPNVSGIIKKAEYDTKISYTKKTILLLLIIMNLRMIYLFDAKVKEKKLVDESNIFGFIDNFDLYRKVAKLEVKAELKAEQDKIVKLSF